MQVWIASVIIIFALSQLWEWLNRTEFSLPVLGVAGLVLAIASNYDKRHSFPFWPAATSPAQASQAIVTAPTPSLSASQSETVPLPVDQRQTQPN